MARPRKEFNAVDEGILTAPSDDRPGLRANMLPDSTPPKATIRPAPNFRAFAPAGTAEANLANAGAMALAAPGAVAVPEVGAVLAAAPAYGLVSDMAEEYETARRSGAGRTDALAQVTEGLTSRENVPAAVLGAVGAARLAAMPQGVFDGGRFVYPSGWRTSPPLLPAGGTDGAGAAAGQAAVAGPYANRLLPVPAPRPAVALTSGTVSVSPQKTPYFDFELLKSASVLKPSAKASVGSKGGPKGGPVAPSLRQPGESDLNFVRRLDMTGPTAKLAQRTQRYIDMDDSIGLAMLAQEIDQMKAAGHRTRVRYTKLSDIKNPSKTTLTEQDFHAILDHGSSASAKLKAAVLSRPDLPEDILMEVASNGTAPMQAAIAGRSDLPEAVARRLMQSGKTDVLNALARRNDLTEAAVARLYLSPRTRYAAATSPSAPPYIAELAAWDPDPYVNYAAVSNPGLSASAASALLTRSSNLFVLDKLASRTDVSPESLVNALGQFAADGSLFEDRWAARNNAQPSTKTSPKRGDKPVAPPLGERVLGHLLLNPTLPQASLEGMLSSLDRALNPSLRGAILRRRGTTDKLDMYRRLASPSDDMTSLVRGMPPLLDKRGRDRFGIKKAVQTALSNPDVQQRLEGSVQTVGTELAQKMDDLEPKVDALLADRTPVDKTSAVAGDSKIYTSVNSYRTLEDAWGGAVSAAVNDLRGLSSQIRIPGSVSTLLQSQSGDAALNVLGDVGLQLQRHWGVFDGHDPLLKLSPKESVLPDVFDKTISPLLSRMSSLQQKLDEAKKQADNPPFEPVLTSPFAEALASRVFSPEIATSMVLESLTRPPTSGWRYDDMQYEHPVFQLAAKHPGLNNPAVLDAVTDGVVAESRKLLPSILDKIAMSQAHPRLVNDYVRALSEVADLDPRIYAMRDIDVYSPGDLWRFITPQQLTERSWSAQNMMGNYVYDGFKTSSQSIRLLGSAKTILESPGTTVGRGFVMDGYTAADGRPHDPTQGWYYSPNTVRAQIADYGDPSVRFPRLKLGQAINSYLRLRGLDEALGSGSPPLYDLVPTTTTPIERKPYHAHNELRRYFDNLGVAHTEVVAGHNAPDIRPSAFIIPERMMTHRLSSVIREMYPHADIITSRSTDDRAAKTREYMRAGHREDAKGGNTRSASKGGDASGAPGASVPSSAPAQSDGPRIVINPQVFGDKRDALCVAFNEAFRLVMEETGFEPVSEPTEAQRKFFSDTAYADDELQLRRTILARIATLDTSVKDPTDEQLEETAEMLEMVMEVGAPQNEWEQSAVQRLHDMVVRTRESPQSPAPTEKPEETGSAQAAEGAGVTMTGSELDFLRRRYESGASMNAQQRALVEAADAQGIERGDSGFVTISTNPQPGQTKPGQPVAQPEQPVAQPEQPVAQPEQPVAQPEQPVAQPEQPAKPIVKVGATSGGTVDWNGNPTTGSGMRVPNQDELAFLRRRRDSGASLSLQQRRILELTDGNDLA